MSTHHLKLTKKQFAFIKNHQIDKYVVVWYHPRAVPTEMNQYSEHPSFPLGPESQRDRQSRSKKKARETDSQGVKREPERLTVKG